MEQSARNGSQLVEVEEVDAVLVADARPLPAQRSTAELVRAQAAVVAGSFVVGAATAVVVAHRRAQRASGEGVAQAPRSGAGRRREPLVPRRRAPAQPQAVIEVRREVRPVWPARLPRPGMDGLTRRRDDVLERLLHVDGAPATVRVAQPRGRACSCSSRRPSAVTSPTRRSRGCGSRPASTTTCARSTRRFATTALIGASVRTRPQLRIPRRPEPFEVLCWAICEQLIEYRRAVEIERGIVGRLGRRCAASGLRDLPRPRRSPPSPRAELERLGLSAGRSLALRRAAAEVASGRVDLRAPDHERGWARLRAIPGIGQWTVDVLALHGQGRYDRLPAGDLSYLRFVGRHLRGDPRARATEDEVRELFAPYGRWAGLAGAHALGAPVGQGSLRATAPGQLPVGSEPTSPSPSPGRNSFVATVPTSTDRVSSSLRRIQSA